MCSAKNIICTLLHCYFLFRLVTSYEIKKTKSNQIQNPQPQFTSHANTYREKVGETVVLLCQVEALESSTVIWKQFNRIISAGDVIIRKDDRFSLLHGYNLQISNLRESDAGEYVCEIETYGSPLDQVNVLEILVPPIVKPQPSDGKFVVRKGSTITLECEAKGNPQPVITWKRENNGLLLGDPSVKGYAIILQDVTRHHSGVYTCTANNSVGVPAIAEIDLKVLYSPEVSVDLSWIRSKNAIEAEISCTVFAEPKAEVKWYKDTMLIDTTKFRKMEKYGHKFVLVMNNVKETDFGNYSCMADNSLGTVRGSIELSGRPLVAKIITPTLSSYNDQYNLTWIVDSFLPIEEYRILYRATTNPNLKIESDKFPTEWTNIIPPLEQKFKTSAQFRYVGFFVFYSLVPLTQYEVIIQSRNKEGWSDASDIFKFSTRSHDYNPMELASQDSLGYISSSYKLTSSDLPIFISSYWLILAYK